MKLICLMKFVVNKAAMTLIRNAVQSSKVSQEAKIIIASTWHIVSSHTAVRIQAVTTGYILCAAL